MKMMLRKQSAFFALILLPLIGFQIRAKAQNVPTYSSKTDSALVADGYNNVLPLFGAKMQRANIVLPQPHGFAVNIYYGVQNVEVENLQVGLSPFSPVEAGVVFEVADFRQDAQTVNFKFDTWVLPFLNVNVMGGVSNIENEIKLDSKTNLTIDTKTSGSFIGVGGMLAGVMGNVYAAAEANAVYAYSDNMEGSDRTISSSLKVGPVFRFKDKPNRNLILWVGGLHTDLQQQTKGSYEARELFPGAQDDIDRTVSNLDSWYNGLDKADQDLYADEYTSVRNGLEYLSNGVETGVVNYQYDKKLELPWNLVVGAQYQFSPAFQIHGEMQILGDRTAGLISFNYRFGN